VARILDCIFQICARTHTHAYFSLHAEGSRVIVVIIIRKAKIIVPQNVENGVVWGG